MQKKIICILVSMLLILTILPITGTVLAGDEENPKIRKSDKRPFQISTSGVTCPMRIIHNTGWLCIFQMLQPWPDQMYFSLFGIINYENGTTTIVDNNAGETVQKEGAHKVLFYNFYGPVSSFGVYNVSVEGDAAFAMVIGG